eukprot:1161905-Pelagomonas_calceolata.AAC.6
MPGAHASRACASTAATTCKSPKHDTHHQLGSPKLKGRTRHVLAHQRQQPRARLQRPAIRPLGSGHTLQQIERQGGQHDVGSKGTQGSANGSVCGCNVAACTVLSAPNSILMSSAALLTACTTAIAGLQRGGSIRIKCDNAGELGVLLWCTARCCLQGVWLQISLLARKHVRHFDLGMVDVLTPQALELRKRVTKHSQGANWHPYAF